MQTTLVILKPDAVERSILWEVISRIERKWLKIIWMKMMKLEESLIKEHYAHLVDKPFFPDIQKYMTRTPVVVMALQWVNAVATMRNFIWATNPQEAAMWTIRWDFAMTVDFNIIHASDSPENAEIELERFFAGKNLFEYSKITDSVI